MVRGFYTAGTGMMLQRRQMEVVTNNIVNAETTGYKKDIVVSRTFDDVLIERIQDRGPTAQNNYNRVGPLNFGTRIDTLHVDFKQGNLEQTDNPGDIALAGDGFFVVQTPEGLRYTRNSAWNVNSNGYLVNSDGHFLMGQNGPLNVGRGDDFTISQRGQVIAGGVWIDNVRVVDFEDRSQLRKIGHNLYDTEAAAQEAAGAYEVLQGFLENSNVEIAREMVDMITTYRTYESNQRMLTMVDEIVGKAVNEIGRLR